MLFNNYLKRNYLSRPIYVLNTYVLFSMILSSFFPLIVYWYKADLLMKLYQMIVFVQILAPEDTKMWQGSSNLLL